MYRRRKAKVAKQIVAPLPQIRLRLSFQPFAQTAVDFGDLSSQFKEEDLEDKSDTYAYLLA